MTLFKINKTFDTNCFICLKEKKIIAQLNHKGVLKSS